MNGLDIWSVLKHTSFCSPFLRNLISFLSAAGCLSVYEVCFLVNCDWLLKPVSYSLWNICFSLFFIVVTGCSDRYQLLLSRLLQSGGLRIPVWYIVWSLYDICQSTFYIIAKILSLLSRLGYFYDKSTF